MWISSFNRNGKPMYPDDIVLSFLFFNEIIGRIKYIFNGKFYKCHVRRGLYA